MPVPALAICSHRPSSLPAALASASQASQAARLEKARIGLGRRARAGQSTIAGASLDVSIRPTPRSTSTSPARSPIWRPSRCWPARRARAVAADPRARAARSRSVRRVALRCRGRTRSVRTSRAVRGNSPCSRCAGRARSRSTASWPCAWRRTPARSDAPCPSPRPPSARRSPADTTCPTPTTCSSPRPRARCIRAPCSPPPSGPPSASNSRPRPPRQRRPGCATCRRSASGDQLFEGERAIADARAALAELAAAERA